MMKKFFGSNNSSKIFFVVVLIMIMTGCSFNDIPEETLDFPYLDERALENPEEELTYSEVNGEYVHDFIKDNKNKAIRWTATVTRVENNSTYELQEPLLPAILVTFADELNHTPEVGDVLTFEGVLTGYGETFGKDPLWVVRPASLESTTTEEQEELANYQQAARQAKEGADIP
ncbi:hypothetical protein FZC74_07705 [Sutcliffiella horikoshii]|uniref:Uncharacterized protein n=1 Tax=Sutcliffiella horikoshii TaxID=79883 RepID=A0AA94WRT3_9BACI|nr:hypothetical protein [Sutcliffiella horikoshii]TYS60027.1 hypothetical protein FZC74_07705 [Sutcliffiella horikoshii]